MTLKNPIIILCLLGISACSSEKDTETNYNSVVKNLGKAIISKAKSRKKAPQTTEKETEQTLNRKLINDSNVELLLIRQYNDRVVNLLQKTAQNGTRTTYRFAHYTVTLDRGLITATRGIGLDLMAQGTDIPLHSMFSNQTKEDTYVRKFRYLNADSQLETTEFRCNIIYEGQKTINIIGQNHRTGKYLEQCDSLVSHFENQYWVNPNTLTIWKSIQKTHPALGSITVEKLN